MQCTPERLMRSGRNVFIDGIDGTDATVMRFAPLMGRFLDGAASARAAIRAAESAGGRIAAFYCESLMSCAGQIILPPGYLKGVYAEMRRHGAVCVADEVQSGFGRIGKHMWGFETQGVMPDIVVMGKAMGNGFPLAGLIVTPELAASFANGMEYFNTVGGGNAACATGLAVLNAIENLHLRENATKVGNYLLSRLRDVQKDFCQFIGDVRGMGLFIGIEVVTDPISKEHAPAMAKWIKESLKARYILISTDGPYENVLKIKPPMVFSIGDADKLISNLRDVLQNESPAAAEGVQALELNLQHDVQRRKARAAAYFQTLELHETSKL